MNSNTSTMVGEGTAVIPDTKDAICDVCGQNKSIPPEERMWGMGTIIRLHIPNQPMVRLCFDCVPAILQIPTLRANQKRLCDALRPVATEWERCILPYFYPFKRPDFDAAEDEHRREYEKTDLLMMQINLACGRQAAALLREVEGGDE